MRGKRSAREKNKTLIVTAVGDTTEVYVTLESQAEMVAKIAKDSEGTVDDADAKLRKRLGGRPVQLPSASAWSTLEHIRNQHTKKNADKKRAAARCSSILAFSNTRKGQTIKDYNLYCVAFDPTARNLPQ